MVTDGNQTYCDHFKIYNINTESLWSAPETNMIFYVNCTSIKKKKKKHSWFSEQHQLA